jgi:hypothetical protein
MAELARDGWLRYRAALLETLQSEWVLGGVGPLYPNEEPKAFDETLDASESLEFACRQEKETEQVDAEQGDDQLLAAAMIDFLLAGELALTERYDELGLLYRRHLFVEVPPDVVRRANWEEALQMADRVFGTGGEPGPEWSRLPVRPTPPFDVESSFSDPLTTVPRRQSYGGSTGFPPIGGAAATGGNLLNENAVAAGDTLVAEAVGPTTQVMTALAVPGYDLLGGLGGVVPDLPSNISEYLRSLADNARRALARVLRAVSNFVRKLIAAADGTLPSEVKGLALPEVVKNAASWLQTPIADRILRHLVDFEGFRSDVDKRLKEANPSVAGIKAASDAFKAVIEKFKRRVKWIGRALFLGGTTFMKALTAAVGPVIPIAVLALAIAYIGLQLRMRLETLSKRLLLGDGIPSIAESFA